MNRSRSANRAAALALAAAALFGTSTPLAKMLLKDVEPIPMAAFLYLGGGLAALGLLSIRSLASGAGSSGFEAPLARADIPWLAGAILVGGVAAPIWLLFGLATASAGTVSLLLNFETVATTLIAAVAFREATGRRVWMAVLVITSASVLLSLTPNLAWVPSGGALAVLGSCALWGLDNNLTRKVSAKNPIAIVAIKGLTAGALSLLLAMAVRSSFPAPGAALAALALGSASYGLSLGFFVRALRDLGAARTGALFGTAPFIGAALSFVVFPEIPTPLFMVSGLLMAVGATLLLKEEHQHRHYHPAMVHDHRHRHDDGHHDHLHAPGEIPTGGYHSHPHEHVPMEHTHSHTPDLHHDHQH